MPLADGGLYKGILIDLVNHGVPRHSARTPARLDRKVDLKWSVDSRHRYRLEGAASSDVPQIAGSCLVSMTMH